MSQRPQACAATGLRAAVAVVTGGASGIGAAAFIATPLTAPYGATKSAVAGLSRALRVEGAALGVRVSVLCPGVVRTPILDNAGRHGRVRLRPPLSGATLLALAERARPMDADTFARKTLADVVRNRAVIVHPSWWRALRFLSALAPSLVDAFSRRELARLRALDGGSSTE